ncbi:MAG: galactokinase family protein [Gemmatimonadales bacterium]
MPLSRLADGLRDSGLSEREIARKLELFGRAEAALTSRGVDRASVFYAWVPGRIEFLGKHTDYAGGRSLLCAIERGFCVVASPRADGELRVLDVKVGDGASLRLDPSAVAPPGHWTNYPLTVARRVASNFGGALVGADVAFASDLPSAAGISSSSAFVVASFLVLARVNALAERPEYQQSLSTCESLAEYLGAVENGLAYRGLAGEQGVGTFGGSEDHTAILCGREHALVQYSFCPVRHERTVELPPEHTFMVASSGVAAEKSGAALASYNRLAKLARDGAARLDGTGGAPSLADALRRAALAEAHESLESTIGNAAVAERVRQFAVESDELVPAAADALAAGDLDRLGRVVDRSMQNAVALLHNQIEETIYLARRARELGAVAASAFGAGFGGSVWALVRSSDADACAGDWLTDYRRAFPARAERAEVFVTRAAGPSRVF